jgi:hypothetical protein
MRPDWRVEKWTPKTMKCNITGRGEDDVLLRGRSVSTEDPCVTVTGWRAMGGRRNATAYRELAAGKRAPRRKPACQTKMCGQLELVGMPFYLGLTVGLHYFL